MAFNYRMGVSTVKEIVEDVCDAIWNIMSPIVMPQPTEQAWRDIAKYFKDCWHFPNYLGALDGKHAYKHNLPNKCMFYLLQLQTRRFYYTTGSR